MDNYLSAEPAIIARLTAEVPELRAVLAASDLDGVAESNQLTPAVHVLYYGDRVVEGQGRSSTGEVQCVDQVWYVVLAVRNVRNQLTNEAARSDAGPLISKVLKALQGWKPTAQHSPLHRINGASPGFKAGFAYLPYCFTTRIIL